MARLIDRLKLGVRIFRQSALRLMASLTGGSGLPEFTRPLIIAPHPDDETFGLGGIIAAHKAGDGGGVHIVFLTSGGASHSGCCGINPDELGARREAVAIKATAVLGVPRQNLHFLRWPDGQLPHPNQPRFAEVSTRLAELIAQVQPDAIFTPHPFEGWSDHIAAGEITREAIKKAEALKSEMLISESGGQGTEDRGQSSVVRHPSSSRFYHYCVWFWFSMPLRKAFQVDWRNAFTVELGGRRTEDREQKTAQERKREAMRIYLEDLAPCGKPTCGDLPEEFLHAFDWNKELFFRVPLAEGAARSLKSDY